MYIEIYVHPSLGNDESTGTGMHPYRTVNKAVSVIYEINNKLSPDEECNINIMLGCGVNKINSPVVIENLKKGMNLKFRPWDDMYTTLSCAVRISGSDFKYDTYSGLYTYESSSDENGLYINGKQIDLADSLESLFGGCAFINKNLVVYSPDGNENLQYSLTELAGSHNMFEIKNCENIIFENIDFTGIGDASSAFITLEKCSCVDIRNCRFNNSSSKAIRCVNGSETVSIIDCEFIDVKSVCIELCESSFVRAENNYFDSCCDFCIRTKDTDSVSVLSSTFQSLPLPVCDVNFVSGFSFEKNRIVNPVSGRYVLYIEQENSKIKICDNFVMADLLPVELFENHRKITDSEKGSINIYDNIIVNQSDEEAGVDSENELSSGSGMKCSFIHGKSASEFDGAIEIINNAGYRKKIKNYGDII